MPPLLYELHIVFCWMLNVEWIAIQNYVGLCSYSCSCFMFHTAIKWFWFESRSISHLSAGSEIRNIFLFVYLLSRMKTLFGPIFARCSVVEAMLGNISFIYGKIKDCDLTEDGNWKFLLLCPILHGIKSTHTDDGRTRYLHQIKSRYRKWVIVLDDTDEVWQKIID